MHSSASLMTFFHSRSGGARIYYIFNNVFGHALDVLRPCVNLTNDDIRTAIRNSTGPRCSLFVPELAFDLLVRPQIKLLEIPSLQCVDHAFKELSKICNTCGTKVSGAYCRDLLLISFRSYSVIQNFMLNLSKL